MKDSSSMPTYPLIITDKSGYLDLIDNEEYLGKTNVLGFLKEAFKKFKIYGANGDTWTVNEMKTTYPINGLTKFMAYTVYNPFINVSFRWTLGKKYQLDTLKSDIRKQINLDDDILTQWEEPDVIKNEIDACNSFEEIVATLRKFVFQREQIMGNSNRRQE